jgi:cytochrome b pre-mRNA-processing protein 3
MYLISVRLRCFPRDESPTWQQHLLDHFFYDAENRMVIYHNMHSRGIRQRYLKDLFVQWRGLLAAYDEGLAKGDAILAAALWRNVFKADENVDVKNLALVVSYMRRALRGLDSVSDDSLVAGLISFGSPAAELGAVELRSKMMDVRLKE